MPDLKITWKPRTWYFRQCPVNDLSAFEGIGWLPSKNCITTTPPIRTTHTLPTIASNHVVSSAFTYFNALNLEDMIVSHYLPPAGLANQTFARITMSPLAYSALTGLVNMVAQWNASFLLIANATLAYMTTYSHGLVKINLGTGVMSQVTGATGIKKVTRHLSRLIGISPIIQSNTVKWSVAGDFDDWTGPGSGSNTFILENGTLEGIFVVNNVVVILGSNTIILGYPTGRGDDPYRFEELLPDVDVYAGGHVAKDGNILYYAGYVGIYKLENFQQTKIDNPQLCMLTGTEINDTYNIYLYHRYRERIYNPALDRMLDSKHLACYPTNPGVTPLSYHFDTQQWYPHPSKDRYNNDTTSINLNSTFGQIVEKRERSQLTARPIQYIKANKLMIHSNHQTYAESSQHLLVTPTIHIGGGEAFEFTLEKILIRYAYKLGNFDQNGEGIFANIPFSLFFRCTHHNITTDTPLMNKELHVEGNLEFREQWIDLMDQNITGQFFKMVMDFGYDNHIVDLFEIEFIFIKAGDVVN